MAMIQGRLTTLSIGGVLIGKKTDATFSWDLSLVDVKNHDSGGFEEFLAGWLGATMDCTTHWDDADAGQEDVIDNIVAGTSVAFVFRPTATAGTHEFTGTAFVTKITHNGSNDNAHSFSWSAKPTGTITRAASHA